MRGRESGGWNQAIITYGPGKIETVAGKKSQEYNARQLQVLFDKLFAQGYGLQGSFTGGDQTDSYSTLIFRKP
ncbi:hypothetical protein [Hymenobacter edaphi]|uniref:DUF4177 domain-containing protein n=1 Tax=Hymenobacter edaphi TaxID=2211146 RepID=A0A328BFD4_9BACT|nr:hypothetical protein [Hymenobacter edaphi]RAK63818.1 hypothetical protein DLM85_19910 [Hymenobacter edaphi]